MRGEHLLPLGELKNKPLDSLPPFEKTDFFRDSWLPWFLIDLGDLLVGNSYGHFLSGGLDFSNRLIFLVGAFRKLNNFSMGRLRQQQIFRYKVCGMLHTGLGVSGVSARVESSGVVDSNGFILITGTLTQKILGLVIDYCRVS
jgi:hypothetical protein